MYKFSDDTEVDERYKSYFQHGSQTVSIGILDAHTGSTETTITLTEADLVQGGLTIDRSSISGARIELGSAIAAELNLKIRNPLIDESDPTQGRKYDMINFEGASISVALKASGSFNGEVETVELPMGVFIVDTPPRHLRTISISALDKMVLFDVVVGADFAFNDATTVESIVRSCVADCLGSTAYLDETSLEGLKNRTFVVPSRPTGNNLTYRTLIQWCAALMGACAYMDAGGKLAFRWYDASSGLDIKPENRYSSDIYEQIITVTGVVYSESENNVTTVHSFPSSGNTYPFDLTSNELIQQYQPANGGSSIDTALSEIHSHVSGLSYLPYSANIFPSPWLYPMDAVTVYDATGKASSSIITDVTVKMNASTGISGQGETAQYTSYAPDSGFTETQSQSIGQFTKGQDGVRVSSVSSVPTEFENNTIYLVRGDIAIV